MTQALYIPNAFTNPIESEIQITMTTLVAGVSISTETGAIIIRRIRRKR